MQVGHYSMQPHQAHTGAEAMCFSFNGGFKQISFHRRNGIFSYIASAYFTMSCPALSVVKLISHEINRAR